MVREIIHIQVGQCGNQIGNSFWNTVANEHNLTANGKFKGEPEEKDNQQKLDKINVYYQETGTMRFVPRAFLVDLEPGTMDVIKAFHLFRRKYWLGYYWIHMMDISIITSNTMKEEELSLMRMRAF